VPEPEDARAVLAALADKAARKRVEVEDLLQVALLDAPGLPATLRQLSGHFGWSEDDGGAGSTRRVPLGKWVDIICTYLEDGLSGLVDVLTSPDRPQPDREMAIGVLEVLESIASVRALLNAASRIDPEKACEFDIALKIVAAFNILLSFSPERAAELTTEEKKLIREFVCNVARHAPDEAATATAYCALRSVGDKDTISYIKSQPPLGQTWAGTVEAVIKAIRKNLKIR
jgi:hypothetical protein